MAMLEGNSTIRRKHDVEQGEWVLKSKGKAVSLISFLLPIYSPPSVGRNWQTSPGIPQISMAACYGSIRDDDSGEAWLGGSVVSMACSRYYDIFFDVVQSGSVSDGLRLSCFCEFLFLHVYSNAVDIYTYTKKTKEMKIVMIIFNISE